MQSNPGALPRAVSLHMGIIYVCEAGVRAVPGKVHLAHLAVAVFGHDALGNTGVCLFAVVIICLAVQKQHHVRVLFNRAGISQVAQHGTVVGAVFSAERESWLSAMMGTFSSFAIIFRFRVISLISCTRFSVRLPVLISCR